MRLSTLVVGVLCGFPLNEAATIWPRFRPAIEVKYHLDKRVVVEPVPKIPPKVITPGTSPKEGPGPGQSCARSWLWRRACTPPSNPDAEPGSSPGNPSAAPGSPPDNPTAEPGSSPGNPSSNPAGSPGSSGAGMIAPFSIELLIGFVSSNRRFVLVQCLKFCPINWWRVFFQKKNW